MSLTTARLLLRPLQASDHDPLAAMQADVRVTSWLGSGPRSPARAAAEARCWIAGFAAGFADVALCAVAARDAEGWPADAFLGLAFLGSVGGGEVQLGYRFRHAAWGQGFASEAAGALLRHGLHRLALPRIVAFTRRDNHASAAVLRKIGMRERGIRMIDGYHARDFLAEAAGVPPGLRTVCR